LPRHKSITDAAAKRFKAKQGQVDHYDCSHPGLHLRVSHTGRKSWNYVYRLGGRQTRLQLDLYPTMSVQAAHDAWRKARDAVRSGRSPAVKMAATDFIGVFEEWLQRDQANNRSLRATRQALEKYVVPHWQRRSIAEIGRRECLDVIDAIADAGKLTAARRVHARLHRLFKWAIGRGIIEINPLNGVDKPGADIKRDRVLSDAELAKVWTAAERLGFPYGPALQLLILTGARREEIGKLRWCEVIDGAISLEGARTKNGEPHVIPLSTAARTLLGHIPRISGDFVFTFSGRVPVSGWSQAKIDLDALAGLAVPWRTHDLRRTCATGLQKLGTPLQVTEAILGHTAGSRAGVVGIYQRHGYADEKLAALEAWGAHVTNLIARHA
jgi:integrase